MEIMALWLGRPTPPPSPNAKCSCKRVRWLHKCGRS